MTVLIIDETMAIKTARQSAAKEKLIPRPNALFIVMTLPEITCGISAREPRNETNISASDR